MKIKIQHVSNNYSINIGTVAFEALKNYRFQIDGCNESLESEIQQIEGVTFAELSFSNGEFGEEYEDFIGLTLFTDDCTTEILGEIEEIIKDAIKSSLRWKRKTTRGDDHETN